MGWFARGLGALALALSCGTAAATSDFKPAPDLPTIPSHLLPLTPPDANGPVQVYPAFELHDINRIDDVEETFEFTGVLSLTWKDPRQAFRPTAGVEEIIFQGNYQFNEVSTGWYPQVVLVNQAGAFDITGVVLRIRPDGTSTLIQTISAIAEVELDMRLFPFDDHRLEAEFEILGFSGDEVQFQLLEGQKQAVLESTASLPQWRITGLNLAIKQGSESYAGRRGASSTLIVGADVERSSFYIRRLISFPLIIIVLLSFSVFWMERSSLGDRISVSFIGILTGVSYQLVMAGVLPTVAYVTLIHAFLILSFLTMSSTVLINLWVGALDKKGHFELGDRIDRHCRWLFPGFYFGTLLLMTAFADVLF